MMNPSSRQTATEISRRNFLSAMGALGVSLSIPQAADAALPEDKVKAVHYFTTPGDANGRQGQPMVNQSTNVVIIETERGLAGIGEGGEPRTMEECASMLIGLDPFRIDNLWQRMMRGYFYPAGREKLHSLGALDLALWDLKAKALDVPVWQLLGGKSRNYVELYATAFPESARRHARRCGARLPARPDFALTATPPITRGSARWTGSNSCRRCMTTAFCCTKGAGDGGWAIDFHTELDPPGRDQPGHDARAAASLFL